MTGKGPQWTVNLDGSLGASCLPTHTPPFKAQGLILLRQGILDLRIPGVENKQVNTDARKRGAKCCKGYGNGSGSRRG